MRIRTFVVCLLVLRPVAAAGQSVNYLKFTPSVIPAQATAPLLIEAEMTGVPTRVFLEFQPVGTSQAIELRDNGTGGDRQAGDNIWTAQVPVAPILAARRSDDVHRVFFGFLNVLNGATNVLRGNMFISVHSGEIGTSGISRLSQFVQATSRVVNIHDAAYFVNRDLTRVTREFYRWFRDDYDFLNLIYDPQRFANRTHSTVKNTIQGIGLALTDNTAALGSAGRLQGVSQFPIPTFFDGAETGHIHELGHQWVNFLNFPPLSPGIPHWPLSSMAGGVMGFSIGGQGGQGGSFNCDVRDEGGGVVLGRQVDAPEYTDFDLYLMGLMPASEVRPQIVFNDPASIQSVQCVGQTYGGSVTRVTVDDIIGRYGPRRPAAGEAPTRFRVATIFVTRDELATPETMWLYTYFAARGELEERVPTHSGFLKEIGQPFHVATRGRATLDMSLNVAAGGLDFELVPTPGSRTVTAGAAATFSISAMPQGTAFDQPVRFSCGALPANASCSFNPIEIVPGASGRDTVLTISTRSGSAAVQERAGAIVGIAVLLLAAMIRRPRGLNRQVMPHALIVAALVVLSSCGGDAGEKTGPPPPPSTNTPAGTYQIVLTATAGAVQRSTVVTVVVQ